MPRHASADLFQADVFVVLRVDLADDTSVFVALGPFNGHLRIEYHFGQRLPGLLAEGLGFFRRVNALQSDGVLSPTFVQNLNGVAITDTYDQSVKLGGCRHEGQHTQGHEQGKS